MKSIDRASTVLIIALCAFYFLWVAPNQIEDVSYGRVVPKTFPFLAVGTILCAAIFQLILAQQIIPVKPVAILRVAVFSALPIAASVLMLRYGFEYCAPLLAILIMWIMGERRWYWFVVGGAVLPLGFWLLVEQLLNRILP